MTPPTHPLRNRSQPGAFTVHLILAPLLLLGPVFLLPVHAQTPLPLTVRDGCCEAILSTKHASEQFYLVVGSLARGSGLHRVTVEAAATTAPVVLPVEAPGEEEAWAAPVRELAERLARARLRQNARGAREPAPPAGNSPPRQKTFHLFIGDKDFQSQRGYTAVVADLWAVGRHCQVYVDREHSDRDTLRPTVEDAVRTFDDQVRPVARARLGQVLDVDRDGRFTILFTGWLSRLQEGKVSLGGFVRGSDFYRDVAAPFSNRCDMMYLNTNLRPGAHLRTLLAHEYTHAVVFSEHVFGDYLPVATKRDEDSWLNEALAHLAEEMHGHGWSNLDYRVSAFLNAPERYALVVPDYYGSGVWRDPGTRGSAYLFLRWCRDRCGDDLAARLIQSNLHGVLNLEVATQRPFAALFREWTVALLLGGRGGLDVWRPLGSRVLCGPRFAEVPLRGGRRELRVAPTGAAYLLLHSPGAERTRLRISADPKAELQVTLIPAGSAAGRLSLSCEPDANGSAVRLTATAHGGPIRLDGAAWERLVPTGEGPDTSHRSGRAPAETVRAWFGDGQLQVGQGRGSVSIPLPRAAGKEPLVFRAAGTDASGKRVAAWVVFPAAPTEKE